MSSTKISPPSAPLDPAFVAGLRALFEERIAFNRVLGLRIDEVGIDAVTGHIDMRPELIGNATHQRLHGGVISAVLDAMAGIAVMAVIGARHGAETPVERVRGFAAIGTIDLRIDYLRPAIGERFAARAEVLRLGSRIASTRMDFSGSDGKLLAVGNATYIVS